MSGLTKEELEELAALEKEDRDRRDAEAVAAKRQHLEAMRMAKRLGAKHGVPGRDFVILETVVGNIAVRRPNEVELDTYDNEADDTRAQNESFASAVAIEPTGDAVRVLFAANPGLANTMGLHSMQLVKVLREEESKK